MIKRRVFLFGRHSCSKSFLNVSMEALLSGPSFWAPILNRHLFPFEIEMLGDTDIKSGFSQPPSQDIIFGCSTLCRICDYSVKNNVYV